MIKSTLIAFIVLFMCLPVHAQYYYNDMVNNQRVMADLKNLKEQKLRTVNVTSLEADGRESEGFVCRKNINRDFTRVELYTQTDNAYPTLFTSFFTKEGILERTTDSSEVSVTTVVYTYDSKGQLTRIYSSTDFAADDYPDDVSEEHLYKYDDNGIITQLTVIKNGKDSLTVVFMPDTNNNVSIEKNSKTGESFYYYYDDKKRLTDIVHSYGLQKKLSPDFTFEYNTAGQITRMVTSEKEGAYYFTWRYNYENGLRTRERCYSKEGTLMGSVEYAYK